MGNATCNLSRLIFDQFHMFKSSLKKKGQIKTVCFGKPFLLSHFIFRPYRLSTGQLYFLSSSLAHQLIDWLGTTPFLPILMSIVMMIFYHVHMCKNYCQPVSFPYTKGIYETKRINLFTLDLLVK